MIGELQARSSSAPPALICGKEISPGKLSPDLKRHHLALTRREMNAKGRGQP